MATWSEKHHDFAHGQGMAHSACAAPQQVMDSPWYRVLQTRERFVLGMRLKEDPNCMNIDVSQTTTRKKVSSDAHEGALPTCTPGQRVFNMTLCRLLLGVESFRAQGFPINAMKWQETVSDRQLADLSGNALAAGCVLAWILSIFKNLPTQWNTAGVETNETAFGCSVMAGVADFLSDSDVESA